MVSSPKFNLFLVTLLSLIWGSEWLLNQALRDEPQLLVACLRCLIAVLLLMPCVVRKRPSWVSVRRNCLLGIGLIAVPAICSNLATSISPGLTVLLFALTPLVAALFENRGGIPGVPYLVGGVAGMAFLVRGSLSFSWSQGRSAIWTGAAVLVLAASLVRAKEWMRDEPVAQAVFMQCFAAGIVLKTASWYRGEAPLMWDSRTGLYLVVLGIVGTALSYSLLYRLLCYYRASQITVVQWLIPIVGIGETVVLLRRFPPWDSCLGAILALTCTALLFFLECDMADGAIGGVSPLTLEITSGSSSRNSTPIDPTRG